jgi:hypothetical protein
MALMTVGGEKIRRSSSEFDSLVALRRAATRRNEMSKLTHFDSYSLSLSPPPPRIMSCFDIPFFYSR